MTRGRIVFMGGFWEYFLISLGLAVLTIATFGLLLPFFIYWHFHYFIKNMGIELYVSEAEAHEARAVNRLK